MTQISQKVPLLGLPTSKTSFFAKQMLRASTKISRLKNKLMEASSLKQDKISSKIKKQKRKFKDAEEVEKYLQQTKLPD